MNCDDIDHDGIHGRLKCLNVDDIISCLEYNDGYLLSTNTKCIKISENSDFQEM